MVYRPSVDHSDKDEGDELIDSETRRGLVARYGVEWVQALPSTMERLTQAHTWTPVRRLTGGRTACVLLVDSPRGRVVVKVSPDMDRSRSERAALRIMSSNGIGPRVLDYAIDDDQGIKSSVMVLELLGDGNSLRNDSRPTAVTAKALAQVLQAIDDCGRTKFPVPLQPLESHLAWRLNEPRGGGLHGAPPATLAEATEARTLLDFLISTSSQESWVHGTLHPGNLVPLPEKIVAIDPRPFRGDSIYDVAELALKWGSERLGHSHNLTDGLTLWHELQPYMHVDEDRVVAWMRVILATGA